MSKFKKTPETSKKVTFSEAETFKVFTLQMQGTQNLYLGWRSSMED